MNTDLRSIVRENLRDALEGGYEELRTWTSQIVAEDMINYAPDMEGCLPEDIIPFIDEFFGRTPSQPPSI